MWFDAKAEAEKIAKSKHKDRATRATCATPLVSGRTCRTCRTAHGFQSVELEAALDHFEERAAIREYDGGQSRSEAEARALIEAARTAGVDVIDLQAAIATKREGREWER